MIDPNDARHAELMECYCGKPLDAQPSIVCSGCAKAPADCDCTEEPLRASED